ncbi:hypothetical protein Cgig2_025394 [Carnegiea gigantea]|uniref:WAT1-related protein n=1 Tax=Carnegiea gigantea TaxID=171969 RepID=A0A9Q1GZV0_9CARY|nr:hypothetical protein Cgig2_025394 [Carnegiea gigantea]
MGSIVKMFSRAKPYLPVVFLQFGFAGLAIIAKFALNQGMNHYVLVVYRHAIATLVVAPFALVLERPVIDQNLYYAGMKYTTATFVTALCNIVPALTFVMAWIFRLERVNIRRVRGLAKVAGTMVTVGGATLMTLVKGPVIKLPWTNTVNNHSSIDGLNQQNPIKGAIMVSSGCVCWAAFVILQATTLQSYPAEMSLTALICMAGTVEGAIIALVMERGNASIWALHLDSQLLAYVYSGIICSGIGYCMQGMIMQQRGPVFVTAFSPLSMIIVAVMGSFFLAEQLSLGRIMGAVVIVTGLYLVIWGKSKDQQTTSPKANEHILPIESPQSDDVNPGQNAAIGNKNDARNMVYGGELV